jgi:hypothetical protein
MPTLLDRAVREVFRRERIPLRMRWWFAAEGMCDWYRVLVEGLAGPLGGEARARNVVSRIARTIFDARYDRFAAERPSLPLRVDAPRSVGLFMGALHRSASNPAADWVFEPVGGAPAGFGAHVEAERLLSTLSLQERWEELALHLGLLLIALTEQLPAELPRARAILGEICFDAGLRYGRKMKRAWDLPVTPASALEVLRMSEYVFRVNPEHWGDTDPLKNVGYLEGTACPWYDQPGWNGAHCGIFGQFQSGVSAVFGLRYHLTTTIPKNGGHTCRIDVKPIPITLRRKGETAAEKLS